MGEAHCETIMAEVAKEVNPDVPFVSGSISLPSAEQNTLDEPVSTTIVRLLCLVRLPVAVVIAC